MGDAGAPELRADSRYNLDNKFIVENYTASTDVFVVMVQTPDMTCVTYDTYSAVDLFGWVMSDVPGVQSTFSLIDASKYAIAGNNEGNPKWATVTRNQWVLNGSVSGKEMPNSPSSAFSSEGISHCSSILPGGMNWLMMSSKTSCRISAIVSPISSASISSLRCW